MLQIKSKFKIGKRLGASVFEQCQTQKFSLSEARSRKAKRRPRNMSDFGKQLLEKQRLRYTYGLSERQLRKYIQAAQGASDAPKRLHELLETRLDNVMYRLALAPTRRAARQMVSHGHILVNGKKSTIPSQAISMGDTLAVRDGSKDSPLFKQEPGENERVPAQWIKFDLKKLSGEMTGMPTYTPGDSQLDYPAVFEFYSR